MWHSPEVVSAFFLGLGLGLGWTLVITKRIINLGSHMGKSVKQSERLSVHVSQQYAPLKERVERLEREIEAVKRAISEGL